MDRRETNLRFQAGTPLPNNSDDDRQHDWSGSRVNADRAICPDALYSDKETAHLLGYRGKSDKANTNRIHEIEYGELPRVKVTKRKVMFLGRDILKYIDEHRMAEKTP